MQRQGTEVLVSLKKEEIANGKDRSSSDESERRHGN